jgi:GNAT superfamily N-acetyltransferase
MNFKLFLEQNSQLDKIIEELKIKFPGIWLWAFEKENYIEITDIRLPPNMQNQGIGTEILETIKTYAQSVKKPIILSPSAEKKNRKSDLERFYKNNGFKWNKGKNKDYSLSSFFGANMVWRPTLNS